MKKIIKAICPPVIWSALQRLKHKNMFFGRCETFDQVVDEKPWGQKSWHSLSKYKLNTILASADTREQFIPKPFLKGYRVVPCLIVNMLSAKGPCRVLDFAGGSGYIYYLIKPYLTDTTNVDWHVVDSDETGLERGRNFSLKDDHVQFFNRLPDKKADQYDVVYINTSLQYVEDYQDILKELLSFNPSYLVLTRLLAGEMESYVTSQDVMGRRTPCKIVNVNGLSEFLSSQGYQLIFKSPTEETLGQHFDDVSDDLKIPFSLALVYAKSE